MRKHKNANDLCVRMKSQRTRDRPDAQEVLDSKSAWALFRGDPDLETELVKISESNPIT